MEVDGNAVMIMALFGVVRILEKLSNQKLPMRVAHFRSVRNFSNVILMRENTILFCSRGK
jgi:hypothetical protein